MLVTVRRPGARIAPISNTSACRQLRSRESGAKHRITAAKRAGRRGMAAVLWRGHASLAGHPLRRLKPGNGQTRDQRPFVFHLLEAAEEELLKASCLLDLPEDGL